jgi:hypothetical protein
VPASGLGPGPTAVRPGRARRWAGPQPTHIRQRYRIVDAATGEREAGYLYIKDLLSRQPWLDGDPTVPLEVISSARPLTSDGAV